MHPKITRPLIVDDGRIGFIFGSREDSAGFRGVVENALGYAIPKGLHITVTTPQVGAKAAQGSGTLRLTKEPKGNRDPMCLKLMVYFRSLRKINSRYRGN